MKPLFLAKLWKIVYPYSVIGKIALLVLGSLIFLSFEQRLRLLLKEKLSPQEKLRYVNRTN